jgi:hypothetical protein
MYLLAGRADEDDFELNSATLLLDADRFGAILRLAALRPCMTKCPIHMEGWPRGWNCMPRSLADVDAGVREW